MDKQNIMKGLINIGNTCYLNSAIQILANLSGFKKIIESDKYKSSIDLTKNEGIIAAEYVNLIHNLLNTNNNNINPIKLKNALGLINNQYNTFAQNDAYEVLKYIIDALHIGSSFPVNIRHEGTPKNDMDMLQIESIKSWATFFKDQYSILLDAFYGQFFTSIKCKNCGFVSHTFEPFNSISVPVIDVVQLNTLETCLNKFCKIETLDSSNKWKCDKCSKLTNAEKQILIWRSPHYLIIHLKRYKGTKYFDKVDHDITFNINQINMGPYVINYTKKKELYECCGIINHVGSSLNSGHYYSYCKNNGKWFNFNDANISPINNVDTKNAYVIVFKRID